MNGSGNRIIGNARSRAKSLFGMLGGAPVVEGLCPLKDSCDVCRDARKANVRYQAWLSASMNIDFLIGRVSDGSHMESGMSFSPRQEVREALPAFYERFQKEISDLYSKTLKDVQDYVAKYGFTKTEEVEPCNGNYR